MTTRQTPDAVREAAEEIVALPHGLDIGYAQDIARRILAALDSRAGDAGEIDNGYSADDAVDFVFNRLAEKLGLAEWQVVEGSEEWEGDVSATLHRLLIDAGIIDDETGVVATLATPAPAVDAHEELQRGKDEIRSLIESIWRAEFSKDAPNWKPLDDLPGMISQMDNMYAGVRSQRDQARWDLHNSPAVDAVPAGEVEQ